MYSPTLGDPRITTFLFKVPADEDILERGRDAVVPPERNKCDGRGEGGVSVGVDLEWRLCLTSRYGLGDGVDLSD